MVCIMSVQTIDVSVVQTKAGTLLQGDPALGAARGGDRGGAGPQGHDQLHGDQVTLSTVIGRGTMALALKKIVGARAPLGN